MYVVLWWHRLGEHPNHVDDIDAGDVQRSHDGFEQYASPVDERHDLDCCRA